MWRCVPEGDGQEGMEICETMCRHTTCSGKDRKESHPPRQPSHTDYHPGPRSFRKMKQRFTKPICTSSEILIFLLVNIVWFYGAPCKIRAICWKPTANDAKTESARTTKTGQTAIPAAVNQLTYSREVASVQNISHKEEMHWRFSVLARISTQLFLKAKIH